MALWGRSNQTELQSRIEDIQAGLSALGDLLSGGLDRAGEEATRGARAARKSAGETADELTTALAPVASDLRHQIEALTSIVSAATGAFAKKAGREGKQAYQVVEEKVEDNAMLAVVAAAGVGFLLGAMLVGGRTEAPPKAANTQTRTPARRRAA
ncbi:hypothetical protein [Flaviflagellibacter deserti]|uniref:DUF883 domain-containing protein n=1 Tax=Flaviflagellibacter deserti TaxID=2267266 RepID=A0ABV9Z974_9HYPH